MKVLFMGTGAADWKINERRQNEFFRHLTSVRIDDDLMIDCSADTEDYLKMNGISLEKVKNLLITHSHIDHYSPDTIGKLLDKSVTVWSEENTLSYISKDLPDIKLGKINLFEPIKVGDYEIIGVPANHSVADKTQISLHYIIQKGEKTIFWGCDGAWFLNKSWSEIRKYKYDLVVLDGTLGEAKGDYRIFEHNNLQMICEISATMESQDLLKNNCKIQHLTVGQTCQNTSVMICFCSKITIIQVIALTAIHFSSTIANTIFKGFGRIDTHTCFCQIGGQFIKNRLP